MTVKTVLMASQPWSNSYETCMCEHRETQLRSDGDVAYLA